MSCMHGYAPAEGCEGLFSIDAAHVSFGRGALNEVGPLFTDPNIAKLEATKELTALFQRAMT